MFAKCTGLIESSTSVSMRSGSTTFRDLRFFVGDVEGGGGVEESPSLVDDWPPNLSVACLECTVRVGAMPIVRRVRKEWTIRIAGVRVKRRLCVALTLTNEGTKNASRATVTVTLRHVTHSVTERDRRDAVPPPPSSDSHGRFQTARMIRR